jgi:hypothetical protein
MAQPQWVTRAGNLGTIPENVFYQVPLQAIDPEDGNVYYELIAGQLPDGVQVQKNGIIAGIPKPVALVRGVPEEVSRDVTSKFAVRAYTQRVVNGALVTDRINDRTFTITVSGQNIPDFVTPAGSLGSFWDATKASIQIQFSDPDPNENLYINVLNGSLPPGLTITRTGLISGVILPLTGPAYTVPESQTFTFTLEITDGKDSNLRAFSIYVYSRASMTADTTYLTADNTFVTADTVQIFTPVLLNEPGSLGTFRSDNFFAYKFEAVDFDDSAVEYVLVTGTNLSLPPGLSLNTDTGWLYGYLPSQGLTQFDYEFGVQVRKANYPTLISDVSYFTMTTIGNIDTDVTWLTNSDLGTINNGAVSTLEVVAVNKGNRVLEYRIVSGSDSRLPQGLRLLSSGHIAGTVSFNTFAVDSGTTTFDVDLNPRLNIDQTTFDMKFDFTVNAYAPQSETLGYRVASITVTNGGAGYASSPTVTISAPPVTVDSEQATAGAVTRVGGVITAIAVNNPGAGYASPPTVTISGGGGADATATAVIEIFTITNPVSVFRTFSITVVRVFNEPYESLYIKAMPPFSDRNLIDNLIQNQDLIPVDSVYRNDDSNFGVAKNVIYKHAYGLTASTLDDYANSLFINHYWKNLVLGEIKTARAVNSAGEVLYEVIYSTVIDNLVNNAGESVGKQVTIPFPINAGDSTEISVVYPNSLINMRDQVIDQIGQISPALPTWMTSKQSDGRVLGFVPAWVIAYVKPGQGNRILYNIQQQFGNQLNQVDFKADRYELDRSLTHNWDPVFDSSVGAWVPYPPAATTFDIDAHYQLPEPNDSSLIFTGGTGYAVGDRILILGSQISGTDDLNDVVIVVNTVDNLGTIQSAFCSGTAPFQTLGDIFTNIVGTNITGTGTGATWDLEVTGFDTTIFDGGATNFIAPADQYTTSDAFDKYLLYPRINILG